MYRNQLAQTQVQALLNFKVVCWSADHLKKAVGCVVATAIPSGRARLLSKKLHGHTITMKHVTLTVP